MRFPHCATRSSATTVGGCFSSCRKKLRERLRRALLAGPRTNCRCALPSPQLLEGRGRTVSRLRRGRPEGSWRRGRLRRGLQLRDELLQLELVSCRLDPKLRVILRTVFCVGRLLAAPRLRRATRRRGVAGAKIMRSLPTLTAYCIERKRSSSKPSLSNRGAYLERPAFDSHLRAAA